jgi:hypothetical protein
MSSCILITGFTGKGCSLPRMAGLGVLAGGSPGEKPPTANLDGRGVLGFFKRGEFWEWSLTGTRGKGPWGAGLGGGISNCRDLIEPPGLGIGTMKSKEGAGSIGEGLELTCAGSNGVGVVLAAISNLFLTVPVDSIGDAGPGETVTISLGTGECSAACLYSEDKGDRESGDGLVFNGRICTGVKVGVREGCGLD